MCAPAGWWWPWRTRPGREALDELEFAAQCKVVPVLAAGGDLAGAIDRAYERGRAASTPGCPPKARSSSSPATPASCWRRWSRSSARRPDSEADSTRAIEQSDNSLVRLINTMILEAQSQGVSDIHIECHPGATRCASASARTAVLRPYLELPHTYRSALIARLKIMCDLDISRAPQAAGRQDHLRPFVQGTSWNCAWPPSRRRTTSRTRCCACWLGAAAAAGRPGPEPAQPAPHQGAVQRPYGMLLCVGPTGSGKTTTLHSALGYINTPERKIWTAEDPVEITQPGLRQVQVNPRIDWTFAQGAARLPARRPGRDHGRRDPRQGDRAVAIEASLTGHLVLSTLHTNSAPETVTRLLDMGMDPFNFADALLGVLAQRLVRRLCTALPPRDHAGACGERRHRAAAGRVRRRPAPRARRGRGARRGALHGSCAAARGRRRAAAR
jgi:type II secretory ATPase GspE/PulE/Tfp pilus assembly ATPase PilB-like protein